jgi:hypothetical protein
MATAATSLLGLALPVTGELSGTWGDTVNNSLTSLLDTAVAGTTTLNTDADVTLTTTTLASNQARQAILLWTAGGTVTRNITAPAQSKVYVVINASSSTQSIVLRGVGPTTGVTIVQGEKAVCAWNGTDFVKVSSTVFSGTVAVANGGTGLATLTANNVILGNGATAPLFVAPSTNGNVLTSNGTTWVSSTPSAGGTTIPSGTAMLFAQTAAPTGFTKSTTHDNKALRVVSGAASSGGSVAFTTAFASQAVSGSVGTSGATTLSTSQIPSHSHDVPKKGCGPGMAFEGGVGFCGVYIATQNTGGGGSHTHTGGTFTGTAINLAVSYVDVIIATKN